MTDQRLGFARYSLRQLVLLLVLLGTLGLAIELLLLEHTESLSQWLPLAALAAGFVACVLVIASPGRRTLRGFQVVMLMFVAIGLLGLYFHMKGNLEFALERDPALGGARLVWKALRGATPTLAPAALAQLGLLGLLYSYRHPLLGYRNTSTFDSVE